jgi:hypothetical protein
MHRQILVQPTVKVEKVGEREREKVGERGREKRDNERK